MRHVLTLISSPNAPALRAKPSVLRDELPRLRQRGFQRVRIAGEIKNLDDPHLVPAGAGTPRANPARIGKTADDGEMESPVGRGLSPTCRA